MDRLDSTSSPVGTAAALRQLAATRDTQAWAMILRDHGAQILLTTRRILNDNALAEDACQETLLQVRDHAGQFKGTGARADDLARNWIMRIAANTALHLLRQRRRAKRRDDIAGSQPREFTLIDDGDKQHLAEIVRQELAEMPEKLRRPLVLHFFAGLNYEQLSHELSCGVGAARVRVHRALEKLRARLQPLGVVVTAAALVSLLEQSPAYAAEAVLGPERLVQWQNLLLSSQQAAVDVLSDGAWPQYVKLGYAAATAVVCGTLAFSPMNPLPVAPPSLLRGEGRGEGSLLNLRSPRAERATEVAVPEQAPAREQASANNHPSLRRSLPLTSALSPKGRGDESATDSRTPSLPDSKTVSPTIFPENALISARAELKLLLSMQHELNQRIIHIHKDIAVSGLTPEIQVRLQRAADDQATIAGLLAQLAGRLPQAKPKPKETAGF